VTFVFYIKRKFWGPKQQKKVRGNQAMRTAYKIDDTTDPPVFVKVKELGSEPEHQTLKTSSGFLSDLLGGTSSEVFSMVEIKWPEEEE